MSMTQNVWISTSLLCQPAYPRNPASHELTWLDEGPCWLERPTSSGVSGDQQDLFSFLITSFMAY